MTPEKLAAEIVCKCTMIDDYGERLRAVIELIRATPEPGYAEKAESLAYKIQHAINCSVDHVSTITEILRTHAMAAPEQNVRGQIAGKIRAAATTVAIEEQIIYRAKQVLRYWRDHGSGSTLDENLTVLDRLITQLPAPYPAPAQADIAMAAPGWAAGVEAAAKVCEERRAAWAATEADLRNDAPDVASRSGAKARAARELTALILALRPDAGAAVVEEKK